MSAKKLLVLGATSATGQLIVRRAQESGWHVTVYGRRTLPAHAESENITTVEGPLDSESGLRQAIAGQDVIISVVGPSSPLAPNTVFAPAYKRIFSIMKAEGVKRIIALSTFSVIDPKDKPSFIRWLLVTALWALGHNAWKAIIDISNVFDHEGSDVDWTLFRVGFLADGPPLKVIDGNVGDGKIGMYLRRADIAEWTLAQAAQVSPHFVQEKPAISSVRR